MVASNDFVDLIYHNRQTKSATLSDFFSTLLDNLFQSFDVDDLTLLLPDDKKQIEQLERLAHLELDKLSEHRTIGEEFEVPVMLSFTLDEPESKELILALDFVINKNSECYSFLCILV